MARLPQPGSDDGTWGDILNDFLGVEHNTDGTLKSSGSLTAKADDSVVLKKANNLSDLASATTARTNLGLGTAATVDVAASGDALASQVVKGDDTRLTDARTPTSHHATHEPGGSDALDYTTIIKAGVLGSRPAAASNNSGLLYFATDDNGGTLYRSTGSSWVQVAAAVNLFEFATLSQGGTLSVKTGASRFYVESSYTIVGVRVAVGTAPTDASIIVDVNKNGTTIFTTQGNRPTIAASSNTATANNPDVTSLVAGDYLSVDIDQVGSTVAGSDLTVQVRLRRA